MSTGNEIPLPDHSELIREVEQGADIARLLRMIRRSLPPHVSRRLIQKLLEQETEALPEIQRLILKTFSDHAIENCVSLMTKCKTNP